MSEVYNPLDKRNPGLSVASALLARESVPLAGIRAFEGAGVYAIYHTGRYPAYEPLGKARDHGREPPIYVGKAIPAGARKGNLGLDAKPGRALFGRLMEHANSIQQATNLDIKDFPCRCLVVDDIWILLGESLLIARFSPVWNTLIDGFGNHDVGGGRHQQVRSRWDTLHPGRAWAVKCQPRDESAEQIASEVLNYLSNAPGILE